ncbi:hypothetical protein KFE25_001127 [Diacronema lutheri]|uniref:Ubiquitin-like domain-containing protein n=1 Tax=Diacronema lutheri TaxID=2081491 RepID=A0A8J5X845_DIALT|nr:hypothetical protein KFE25_001127 [Diacronema lutheri]
MNAESSSAAAELTLAVVLNGARRECRVPAHLTLRELKARLVADDGHETPPGVEHLLGKLVYRGKKLVDDDATLEAVGVQNRDKLMVSYMPNIKDVLAQLSAIRAETAALEAERREGAQVHPELFTRQLLKLDAIDISEVAGEAKEVVRAMRKSDLARLLEMEGAVADAAS